MSRLKSLALSGLSAIKFRNYTVWYFDKDLTAFAVFCLHTEQIKVNI